MAKIRIGVIGVGNMGTFHLNYLNTLDHACVGAICDIDPTKLQKAGESCNAPAYASHRELIASRTCDAILICTPHYDHPPIAIDAFEAGLHVLCEKPVTVSVNAARRLNEIYLEKYRHLKFGIMFNQRTLPVYRKLRELIADGELGEIFRVTWIVTDWFRTWSYYASGGWRATWAGEGGGVLINQCPHNLDLIQWITGMMPTRVTAVAHIAKTHPIEVEDEVNAILEYPNGATGHFITSTGESPGTNRLEIACDRGRIIAENGKLSWKRTRKSVTEENQKNPKTFAMVERWDVDVPVGKAPDNQHMEVTKAFVSAIQRDTPMIADGIEGVRGLELGNAMLMAGLMRQAVDLPLDGEKFDQLLKDLTNQYGGRKTLQAAKTASAEMSGSF